MVEIWYGLNSSGSGTAITLTLASSISGFNARGTVVEFSGISTFDAGANSSTANNTTVITASLAPKTGYNELIIATFKGGTASAGPTNSFIALNSLATSFGCAYLIVNSTVGTYSTQWTVSTGSWVAEIASLKGSYNFGGGSMMLMGLGA